MSIAGGGGGSPKKKKAKAPAPAPAPASTPSIDDYMALLQSDPMYMQQVNDAKASSIADASQLGSGILSALVGRGEVPDIDSVASSLGLSPDVVAWIKNNVDLGRARSLADQANSSGVSEEAALEQAHKTSMGNISDSLAERGMLQSGATPFLTGQEEQRNTKATYDADKALADYIRGAYESFTGAERGRSSDLTGDLEAAYQRALQLYPGGIPSSASPAPPGSGTTLPPGTPGSPTGASVKFVGGDATAPLHVGGSMILHAPRIRKALAPHRPVAHSGMIDY